MRPTTMLAAVTAALSLAGPAAAQTETPGYVPWTDLLPATTSETAEYQSGYNDMCRPGEVDTYQCVTDTIAEMQARYDLLHSDCDHRGLFALAYLRTTEEYQRASLEVDEIGQPFFEDTEFVNHEDAIFAQLYFDAYDRWEAGDRDPARVPLAWQTAFRATAEKSVTSLGDVMLGISAHINRDLPYTLATIGLNNPVGGYSRKPDHDRVNAFLARVPAQLFPEIREKWDPQFSGGDQFSTAAAITLIQEWREAAWRWAERLVEADTDAEREAVEQGIEQYAYEHARGIIAATTVPPGADTSARDAYCRANN